MRTVRVTLLAGGAALLLSSCIKFDPPLSVAAGTTAGETVVRVELADVTGDGAADALIETSAGLVRYEYCGAGCLERQEHLAGVGIVAVDDFDGDGIDDVLTSASILYGGAADGARPEGLTTTDSVAVPPFAGPVVGSADLDGDAYADLVIRVEQPGDPYTTYCNMLGTAGGWFTSGPCQALTDPDATGRDQIAIGNFWPGGADEILYTFDGSLWVFDHQRAYDRGPFATGDIDGDGMDDLAQPASIGDVPHIRLQQSSEFGFVGYPDAVLVPAPAGDYSMALRDINGDGFADLLLDDEAGGPSWRAGNGDGTFRAGASDVPSASGSEAFGDVDGDGLDDVLFANGQDFAGVSLRLNRSTP